LLKWGATKRRRARRKRKNPRDKLSQGLGCCVILTH
jgi:hypothetical protein